MPTRASAPAIVRVLGALRVLCPVQLTRPAQSARPSGSGRRESEIRFSRVESRESRVSSAASLVVHNSRLRADEDC